uniref:Thil AANH domain-containing protein n=1 Tax=Biomphalaria glabrata TaxID=6526 RepID=A0A2C9LIV9_BIOGL
MNPRVVIDEIHAGINGDYFREKQNNKEEDALKDILSNEEDFKNFLALITSLSSMYNPVIDMPYVISSKNGEYIVVEGNRRILALKLLSKILHMPEYDEIIANLDEEISVESLDDDDEQGSNSNDNSQNRMKNYNKIINVIRDHKEKITEIDVNFINGADSNKESDGIRAAVFANHITGKKLHNQPYYIECERKDKRYQKSSLEIKQYLAHDIEKKTGIVGSFDCDFALSVIVYENFFFLCENKRKGVGGLPVGTSGRALILISGGIDSPVAAYELMKRGMEVEYVHFITPPQTSDLALRKVKDLISKLNDFAPNPQKLYIVDFAKMQHEIMCSAKEEYRIVLMRRMFYRLAEAIANNNKIQAIATGESLGQVASQTIENLQSVDSVIDMIVIRPLITFDKVQTIEIAQRIGTYDISIRPYEDCCTLFVPKNPVIKSKTYIAKHEEEKMLMLEILKTIMDSEITEEITN